MMEARLTIAAPRPIRRAAARAHRKLPFAFTSMTRSHSDSDSSSAAWRMEMPAPFTSTSTASMLAKAWSTALPSVTSRLVQPWSSIASRPITRAPAASNSWCVARPIPPAAPVIATTRPCKPKRRSRMSTPTPPSVLRGRRPAPFAQRYAARKPILLRHLSQDDAHALHRGGEAVAHCAGELARQFVLLYSAAACRDADLD